MVKDLEAIPGFTCRRNVNEGEKNSSDNLKKEHSQGGAAKNIKPTCCFARDRMRGSFANDCANFQAFVEPGSGSFDQAHGVLELFVFALGLPTVGISPLLMNSCPSSIL